MSNDQSNTQYRAPANTNLKLHDERILDLRARESGAAGGSGADCAQARERGWEARDRRAQAIVGDAALGVVRLTPLGAPRLAILDSTFAGGAGFMAVKVGGKASTLMAMAIDSAKGRVIVAGTNGNLIAARLWL
jgi:hypothetical protein